MRKRSRVDIANAKLMVWAPLENTTKYTAMFEGFPIQFKDETRETVKRIALHWRKEELEKSRKKDENLKKNAERLRALSKK